MLMEEIAGLKWVKSVVSCAKGIEQNMMYYQHASPSLFTHLKESSDPLSVKFAPSYFSVQRIFDLKQALQEAVVSEEFKQLKLNMPGGNNVTVESAILGDDYWCKAHLFLQLCEPFVRLLATFDIEKSVMGVVYDWQVQALEAVRSKLLETLAVKVLSPVSSVAMCQEIWQDNLVPSREAIHRLGVKRVEDLIFVFNNLRLHSQRSGHSSSSSGQRNQSLSYQSAVKSWDGVQLDETMAIRREEPSRNGRVSAVLLCSHHHHTLQHLGGSSRHRRRCTSAIAATTVMRRAIEELEGAVVVRAEEDGRNPPVPWRLFASPSSLHIRRRRHLRRLGSQLKPSRRSNAASWKRVIEYKFDDDNGCNKVKITTTIRIRNLANSHLSKRTLERRNWAKLADDVREDVGSRLIMVSIEEILIDR
ncbi:hypothetical protein EZV62_002301 [Acer yangbiense]|uniref:Eukaryotic translation initiation factor 3 subunit G N-terminal domain-containing protein n=1 Tax=Acer yangbiense TaxID=1000413 RepID=A0A5C7IYN8_9ROSI|nr:hypothetical protein EZV62_002301 [Acer yangbiense]